MKIKLILFVIILFPKTHSWSQTSMDAKNLLEKASKQLELYDSFKLEFSYNLNNRIEKINQESKGNVVVSGEKYKLNFLGAIQLFDEKNIYTIIPENEEITIIKSNDQEEQDFVFNPTKILNIYKKGYDYHWDILQNVQGRSIQFVKLIPTTEDSDVKSILVGIETITNHIYKIIEVGLNGTITTLTIKNIDVNIVLPLNFFVFESSDYPNYFIIE